MPNNDDDDDYVWRRLVRAMYLSTSVVALSTWVCY